MSNVDRPATAHGEPTSRTQVEAALEAAWNAGRADDILTLLAAGAVIELLPAGRRFATPEDRQRLLRHYLPELELSSFTITDAGLIDHLSIWLLPNRDVGSRPAAVAAPAAPAGVAATGPGLAAPGFLSRLSLGRLLALLAAVAVALPTVFAASNALLDTVYGLKPDWRPDAPPAAIGVTLTGVELAERRIEYESGIVGNLMSYDVELVGYRGNQIAVEWAAFDARSRQRISLDAGSAQDNRPVGVVITEAPNDRFQGSFPIPIPNLARCIFIRVYVGQDSMDSAPFNTHDSGNRACADEADSLSARGEQP